MKVIRRKIQEKNCPSCNYQTVYFYGFEGDNLWRVGLCANCFADEIFIRGGTDVKTPDWNRIMKNRLKEAKSLILSFYSTAKEIKDEKMKGFCKEILEIYGKGKAIKKAKNKSFIKKRQIRSFFINLSRTL